MRQSSAGNRKSIDERFSSLEVARTPKVFRSSFEDTSGIPEFRAESSDPHPLHAKRCCERGFAVVSGLAVGCDTSAHEGALAAHGTTIAVLAHGLDSVYPAVNRRLAVAPGAVDLGRINGLKTAVVTKSPSNYASEVLRHFQIRTDVLVAYHDAARQKPHPDPTLRALERLGLAPSEVWAAGDHADDLTSARAAGIGMLIAVTAWADSEAHLAKAKPTVTVTDPSEVVAMLRRLGMTC